VPVASEFSEDSAKGGKIDQNSHQPQEVYDLIFVQLQTSSCVVPNVVPMNGNLELPPSAKKLHFWRSICIYTGVG